MCCSNVRNDGPWGISKLGRSINPKTDQGDSDGQIFLGVKYNSKEPPVNEAVAVTSGPAKVQEAPVITPISDLVKEVPYGTHKPALLDETIPPTPAPDNVWIAGIWAWRKTRLGFGHWEWVAGAWMKPPYDGAVWAKGGFVNKAWVDGHWK